ncbi:kit ligand a isoform X2 [Nerophis ophidion]|uniref:kit ligand a isoform X2 n=1 Tax=Nerophis ophidion TaxID=159077 RepID=UPI002ADF8471|nr:kit ligand a isoform X2 [Nerophis ophidion]
MVKILMEQFIDALPPRTAAWVRYHHPADVKTAVILAEDHPAVHREAMAKATERPIPAPRRRLTPPDGMALERRPHLAGGPGSMEQATSAVQRGLPSLMAPQTPGPVCWGCGQPGHVRRECSLMEVGQVMRVGGAPAPGPDPGETYCVPIRILICVHLLLLTALGVHSSKFEVNPVTDDVSRLSILKHNIPKDYKIPVQYVPKEEAAMCWVKLNVFYLEQSLQDLADKFGNISSNRKDISIFIQMLQELRLNMGNVEPVMYDFECHYRQERWPTEKYFDFVTDFLTSAQHPDLPDYCEPPPCPTTPNTPTEEYFKDQQSRLLPEAVERSLLSLLLIPFLALIFLLVWKLRSKRNIPQNLAEGELFTGVQDTAATPHADVTEKNRLTVTETV